MTRKSFLSLGGPGKRLCADGKAPIEVESRRSEGKRLQGRQTDFFFFFGGIGNTSLVAYGV